MTGPASFDASCQAGAVLGPLTIVKPCPRSCWLRRLVALLILTVLASPSSVAAQSVVAAVDDAPGGAANEGTFHDRLEAANRPASRIERMRARFVQARFTPMLRRPLESRGVMRQVGRSVRWDTREPQAMTLFTDGRILANYDQQAELVEIYPVSEMVGGWSGGAMPRLGDLEASFIIEPAELTPTMREAFADVTLQRWPDDVKPSTQARPSDADSPHGPESAPEPEPEPEPITADQILSLKLTPRTEQLRRNVASVTVWMHEPSGALLGFETQTPEGERTLVTLKAIELHPPMRASALALDLPDQVRVSYPMGAPDAGRE